MIYDFLIIGATVYGAGVAEANKNLSFAVVERGNICGYEYTLAYKTDGGAAAYECLTDTGRKYKGELTARGALTVGEGEYLPAITPVIAGRYLNCGAVCFFSSNIIDISERGEIYEVTAASFGGTFIIQTRRIIDTTPEYISHRFFGDTAPAPIKKTLNALTENGIYKYEAKPEDDDYSSLRLQIFDEIKKSQKKITLYAGEFDYEYDKKNVSAKKVWRPSCIYGNAVRAFDEGCRAELSDIARPGTAVQTEKDGGEFDIIVAGLGTAGAISAIAAAGRGLKILGIENLTCACGAGTAGAVMTYYYGEKGGLYQTIDDEAVKIGESGVFAEQPHIGSVLKTVALDKRLTCGITYKYHAMAFDVIKSGENKKVTGIRYVDGNGVYTAKAKFVIDCTAEASVCMAAGCEMIGGRISDGRFQPYSSVYYNYDAGKLGYAYVDNGTVNQYDPLEYGKAVLLSSASYVHLRESYIEKKYLGIAPLTGLREGNRIKGEGSAVFEKQINNDLPKDPVYYSLTNLDNHGKDSAFEDRAYRDWITVCGMWGYEVGFAIPAGALIPKGYDGILAAGRHVSLDHTIAVGVRMKDDVQKSGEAAAVMSFLAIKRGCAAKDVPYKELIGELYKSKCLKESDGYKLNNQKTGDFSRDSLTIWRDTPEEIEKGIKSERPGYYMWAAKLLGERAKPFLLNLLNSGDLRAKNNAALALGLLGAAECEPAVIEMISDKSGYITPNGRSYNAPQSTAAMSIAGRMGFRSAVEPLLDVIKNKDYTKDIPFVPYDMVVDRDDLYFQYISHAVAALVEIAVLHRDLCGYIVTTIRENIKNYKFETSMMGTRGFKLDSTPAVMQLLDHAE